MEKWKVKQIIFHQLNDTFDDDLADKTVIIDDDIITNAVQCFNDKDIGFVYPAKSYMVAICYAKWLAEDYGGVKLAYLNDPDLLYGNDPYFKPYSEDKRKYDLILDIVSWDFDETKGLVPDVRKYYEAECGIE